MQKDTVAADNRIRSLWPSWVVETLCFKETARKGGAGNLEEQQSCLMLLLRVDAKET